MAPDADDLERYRDYLLLLARLHVDARLRGIAKRHGRTISQVVFRFALDVGMIALTGTTNADHMRADLEVFDFHLEPEEVERMERLAVP
jgi:diketogulonate reductase-like aldo/keto reductase